FGSLVKACLTGLLVALLLAVVERRLPLTDMFMSVIKGTRQMLPVLVVLWVAWALADVCEHLGTARYLGDLLSDRVSVFWLPTLVFLLASAVSYCTGTSWGTMALLTPAVIAITWEVIHVGGNVAVDDPILMATIGSVLAGSIFGDHCSPISDTTILSSQASGCHHIAHVWTQMPYALTVASVSIVAGTIPVGFGVSIWIALPVSIVLLLVVILIVGRPIDEERVM
ncbi:MAG: hypothetical protein N2C12_06405, partial [Planctomycetales bacterium]